MACAFSSIAIGVIRTSKIMICKRCCIFFVVASVISNLLFAVISGGEVEDESEFNYDVASSKGPENWGKISPEWKVCGSGKLQSPIDLADNRVMISHNLEYLKRTYKPAPAVIKNRGHDIVVEWNGDAGGIIINGSAFKLLQCHWHTPSEHTLNGKRFEMEIHLVHQNSRGEIAVIGIMYKLGCADKFLDEVLKRMKGEEINASLMDPRDIEFERGSYYRYIGSLTVPPCTEGVIWSIQQKVRTISIEQIRALREAVHDGFEDNARPLQLLNKRPVYKFLLFDHLHQ